MKEVLRMVMRLQITMKRSLKKLKRLSLTLALRLSFSTTSWKIRTFRLWLAFTFFVQLALQYTTMSQRFTWLMILVFLRMIWRCSKLSQFPRTWFSLLYQAICREKDPFTSCHGLFWYRWHSQLTLSFSYFSPFHQKMRLTSILKSTL